MMGFGKSSGSLLIRYAAPIFALLLLIGCAHGPVAFLPENPVPPDRVNHDVWNSILNEYVAEGRVDYVGLKKEDSDSLNTYLDMLSRTNPLLLAHEEELAFWINAYNAFVVKAILDGRSPQTMWGRYWMFRHAKFNVGGTLMSLNDIERLVGGPRFNDPRVFFALSGGCESCPALQNQAYGPNNIDGQLRQVTEAFMADGTKNKVDVKKKVLYLSRIFHWHEEQFMDAGFLPQTFFLGYLNEPVEEKKPYLLYTVKYLPFHWTLNGEKPQ